ncbi:hypothetical protein Bpla01_13050 [Burkholderia plantarii]|nr:hypothetical protein Bpla01_13050 [Burkholderia plantarii]
MAGARCDPVAARRAVNPAGDARCVALNGIAGAKTEAIGPGRALAVVGHAARRNDRPANRLLANRPLANRSPQ